MDNNTNQQNPMMPSMPPIPTTDEGGTPPPLPPEVSAQGGPPTNVGPAPQNPSDAGSAAPPLDIPPVITATPRKKFGGGKIIATVLGLLLLVGGIGAGIVLVQQQQLFQQKAATESCSCNSSGVPSSDNCISPHTAYCTKQPAGNVPAYTCGCITRGCVNGQTQSCGTGGTQTCVNGSWGTCTGGGGGTTTCTGAGGKCQVATCDSSTQEPVTGDCGYTPGGANYCCKAKSGGSTGNACTQAGGTCISTSNCTKEGKSIVNGGNGCSSVGASYMCCGGGGTTTCTGAGGKCQVATCNTSTQDQVAADCGYTPGGANYCCKAKTGGGTGVCTTKPSCNDNGCSANNDGCYVNHYWCKEAHTSGGCNDIVLQSQVKSATFNQTCGMEQIDIYCPVCGYPTSKPPNAPAKGTDYQSKIYTSNCGGGGELNAQCLAIKAYDTNWNQLNATQLSALTAGSVVRFAISGTASSGTVDKARFTITATVGEVNQGTPSGEITAKKPGTDEFYFEYTIPTGATSISVAGQIHHSTLGWF